MVGLKEVISRTNDYPRRRTFHSDQGSAYQMKTCAQTLKDNHIFQSMSRKDTCLDNFPMENFFSILKQELYYEKVYQSQKKRYERLLIVIFIITIIIESKNCIKK